MPEERVSDAEIAALLEQQGRNAVGFEYVLAQEVQQARGRRCGNCRWWHRINPAGGHLGRCAAWENTTASSHFCADFIPKKDTNAG